MDKGTAACLGCFACIALYVAFGALCAWVLEWAWNIIIPALFHGPQIDYTEACAIYAALSIIGGLFKATTTKSEK